MEVSLGRYKGKEKKKTEKIFLFQFLQQTKFPWQERTQKSKFKNTDGNSRQ